MIFKEFLNTLDYLANNKIDPQLLSVAKRTLLCNFIFALEKTSLMADHYSELHLYQNKIETHKEEMDIISNISEKDLHNVFQYFLNQKPKITIIDSRSTDLADTYNFFINNCN